MNAPTKDHDVEVRWLASNVGAVEVRTGPNGWMTVPAADKALHGLSFEQARSKVESPKLSEEARRMQRAARAKIRNLDSRDHAIRELAQPPWTPENRARDIEHSTRYVRIADTLARRGPTQGLFDHIIEP